MNQVKTVLFDLGKVLVDFDFAIAADKVLARSSRPIEKLQSLIQTSPLLRRFECGQISAQQFYEGVREVTEYQGTFAEFASAFGDIFSEIPEMVRLHTRVRSAGYPTWIFSNTNDLAVGHIRKTYSFFANFDGYFLSYQLGVMKPEAAIYEAAERATGCRGGEILYLDDFAENVKAGAARGWQTILHVSPEQTIPRVEQLLGLTAQA
jgi:glucose-1-phosphatase